MWQGIIVALVVAVAVFWVGRRLWRTMRGAGQAGEGCGCGCTGPCHQPQPLEGPAPPACGSCPQRPEDIGKINS